MDGSLLKFINNQCGTRPGLSTVRLASPATAPSQQPCWSRRMSQLLTQFRRSVMLKTWMRCHPSHQRRVLERVISLSSMTGVSSASTPASMPFHTARHQRSRTYWTATSFRIRSQWWMPPPRPTLTNDYLTSRLRSPDSVFSFSELQWSVTSGSFTPTRTQTRR